MNSSKLLYFKEYGAGQPLLLVHGLMITGEMFAPIINVLATQYRVIVPDLRGHGQSRDFPPPYHVRQLASDLLLLLDHLGIESTAVLGYSQGGAIAQQLVLDHPQQCNRLILACTYAFNMATFREKLEGYVAPILIKVLGIRRFAKLIISQGLKRVSKERANWVVSLIASQDEKLMIPAWSAAMVFDSRRRLPEIKCPTLIIAASEDDAVPIHHAEMLHKGIAGSQLVVIDGADHALIWSHPNEFARAIQEFLKA